MALKLANVDKEEENHTTFDPAEEDGNFVFDPDLVDIVFYVITVFAFQIILEYTVYQRGQIEQVDGHGSEKVLTNEQEPVLNQDLLHEHQDEG